MLFSYVLVEPQLGEPRRLQGDVLDVETDGRLGLVGAAGLSRSADVGPEGREGLRRHCPFFPSFFQREEEQWSKSRGREPRRKEKSLFPPTLFSPCFRFGRRSTSPSLSFSFSFASPSLPLEMSGDLPALTPQWLVAGKNPAVC